MLDSLTPDPQILVTLVRMKMPFGKYKDTLLCDLPVSYLEWFKRQGFPYGKLGMLLETVLEIKMNGLGDLLVTLKKWSRANPEPPQKLLLHRLDSCKKPGKKMPMYTIDPGAFFDACRRNDLATVQQLCAADPSLMHFQDAKGFTPVLIAVYNHAPEVVHYLLQQGAPADVPDASGNTALMGAAFKGYTDLVEALLGSGVDVNQRNGSGATALTFAATFGRLEAAEKLLEHGALLDVLDTRGKSPIDHAVIQENEPMVRLLERYEQRGF